MKTFADAMATCTNPASHRHKRRTRILSSFYVLRSPGNFIRRATRRGAFAILGNPAIPFAQNFHHPRYFRNPYQRTAPPNLARQRHRGIRAAVLASIAEQKSHFKKQLFARHSEQFTDTRILQRRQGHSAPLQNRRNPPRGLHTKFALRVEEQPPSRV